MPMFFDTLKTSPSLKKGLVFRTLKLVVGLRRISTGGKIKTMKIILKATDVKLTPEMKDYIEEKIGGLKKFLPTKLAEARVEVGRITRGQKQGNVFRAEVNLKIDGQLFRAEQQEEDLLAAIDVVKDELKREIYHFKDKKMTLFRRGARAWKKQWSITSPARFKKSKFFKKK